MRPGGAAGAVTPCLGNTGGAPLCSLGRACSTEPVLPCIFGKESRPMQRQQGQRQVRMHCEGCSGWALVQTMRGLAPELVQEAGPWHRQGLPHGAAPMDAPAWRPHLLPVLLISAGPLRWRSHAWRSGRRWAALSPALCFPERHPPPCPVG